MSGMKFIPRGGDVMVVGRGGGGVVSPSPCDFPGIHPVTLLITRSFTQVHSSAEMVRT